MVSFTMLLAMIDTFWLFKANWKKIIVAIQTANITLRQGMIDASLLKTVLDISTSLLA